MRLVVLLSLLINWHQVNGCLKVNRLSPCGCHALALDSSNIRDYVDEDNQSFSFLPNSTLTAPNVNIDECSIEMTCDTGYNLAIFDAALMIKWFNDYPAVGFCNPTTREWSILTRDTGFSQFVELYGTCVYVPTTTTVTTPTTSTVTTPTTTTVTTPTTTTATVATPTATWTTPSTASSSTNSTTEPPGLCPCERRLLDSSNIRDYITEDSIFYPVLTSPSIVAPTNNSECSGFIFCPETHYLLIFDDTGLGSIASHFSQHSCDPETKTWRIQAGSRFRQIYAVCLEKGDENDFSSTQDVPISSTTTVKKFTSEPTTSGELECRITGSRTFLFAYSTDFTPDVVTKVFNNIANKAHPIYTRIATARFDLLEPESSKIHDSWEEANKTLHSHLPDPSLGYNNNVTGSDVYFMLERFLNEYSPEIYCGVKVWALLKRGDAVAGNITSGVISKIRKYYGTVDTLTAINKTAGSSGYSEQISFLSSKSNGMGYIHYDEDFDRATKFIQTPSFPYLYYAQTSWYDNSASTEYAGCCGANISYFYTQTNGLDRVVGFPLCCRYDFTRYDSRVWIAWAPMQNVFETVGHAILIEDIFSINTLAYHLFDLTNAEMQINGLSNHVGKEMYQMDDNFYYFFLHNYTTPGRRLSQLRIYSDMPDRNWAPYIDDWR